MRLALRVQVWLPRGVQQSADIVTVHGGFLVAILQTMRCWKHGHCCSGLVRDVKRVVWIPHAVGLRGRGDDDDDDRQQ